MIYTMTTPCSECPFLKSMKGFTLAGLKQHASGEFGCHKACEVNDDGVFEPSDETPHCAGALIFNLKRGQSHQMARICERLGMFDPSKLNMTADVR